MTDAERAQAALGIWNKEKGFAAAVLVVGWLTKVCLSAFDKFFLFFGNHLHVTKVKPLFAFF